MSRVVAISNQKGGTAKTSTTLALGAALAERGQRVLLVDLDPQASLTASIGAAQADRPTVYAAIAHYMEHDEAPAFDDYIQPVVPGLALLPSSIDLAAAEMELISANRREYVLSELLASVEGAYDVVLIDCPPSLGLLVVNALTAAREVIVPIVPEYLAAHGLQLLLGSIARIRKGKLNPHHTVAGIVLTMVDNRTTHVRTVIEEIRATIGRQIPILGEIKRSIKMSEAAAAGVPITTYAARSETALAYGAIADTLMHTWGLVRVGEAVAHG